MSTDVTLHIPTADSQHRQRRGRVEIVFSSSRTQIEHFYSIRSIRVKLFPVGVRVGLIDLGA